jgi:hypothetical protein|tara:strand:+ start:3470 stop:4141 length:672 start_codon:yes stop_codon:yes gene_type:complete
MMDVTIYGNLIYDHVFSVDDKYETVGGIANIWHRLRSTPNISVSLSPTSIGESVILADKHQGKRTSKSLMLQEIVEPDIIPAKWNHIAYLDHLPNYEFLSELNGIVSADVCGRGHLNKDTLKYVDIIFVGDGDGIDWQDLSDNGVQYIIHHAPHEIILMSKGENVKIIKVEKIVSNINVLGAGDMFAAEVIRYMKDIDLNSNNLVSAIDVAQSEISKILELSK